MIGGGEALIVLLAVVVAPIAITYNTTHDFRRNRLRAWSGSLRYVWSSLHWFLVFASRWFLKHQIPKQEKINHARLRRSGDNPYQSPLE